MSDVCDMDPLSCCVCAKSIRTAKHRTRLFSGSSKINSSRDLLDKHLLERGTLVAEDEIQALFSANSCIAMTALLWFRFFT